MMVKVLVSGGCWRGSDRTGVVPSECCWYFLICCYFYWYIWFVKVYELYIYDMCSFYLHYSPIKILKIFLWRSFGWEGEPVFRDFERVGMNQDVLTSEKLKNTEPLGLCSGNDCALPSFGIITAISPPHRILIPVLKG